MVNCGPWTAGPEHNRSTGGFRCQMTGFEDSECLIICSVCFFYFFLSALSPVLVEWFDVTSWMRASVSWSSSVCQCQWKCKLDRARIWVCFSVWMFVWWKFHHHPLSSVVVAMVTDLFGNTEIAMATEQWHIINYFLLHWRSSVGLHIRLLHLL